MINSGVKKYLTNSSWLLTDRILRLIIGFFVGIYIARYLGPDRFGILNYSFSYVALFSSIASLGLDEIVISDILKGNANQKAILGTSFILKVIASIIIVLVICISFYFQINSPIVNTYILILSFSTVFQSFNVIDLFFQSKVKAKFSVIANFINLALNSIIRLLLIFYQASLIYFVISYLLDTVFISIGLFTFYKNQNNPNFFKYFDFKIARNLLSRSWPLIFSGLVIVIYMRVDQIMIKQMLGFKSVGAFSIAVKLTELWYFIPAAIGSSVFPAIVNSKESNDGKYYFRIYSLLSFMVLFTIIVSVPTICFSDFLISSLYGVEYKDAIPVLKIYIWATVFVSIGIVSSKWFILENLNKITLYRCIIGVIVNILLNFWLIPIFGIAGAAFSTVISQFIQSYFSNIFFSRTRKIFVLQTKALFLFPSAIFKFYGLFNKRS